MKKSILFLAILISNIALAGNYMSLSDIAKRNIGEHGTNSYVQKGNCQQKESDKCISVLDKDARYHKVIDVEIDDLSKPILSKQNVRADLLDLDICYTEISDFLQEVNPALCQQVKGTGSDENGNTVCEMSVLPYCQHYSGVGAICRDQGDGKHEAYCPVPTGNYDQKIVKKLVLDVDLKAIYDAEQTAKIILRDQLKTVRIQLINAFKNWDSLTLQQKDIANKRLLRAFLRARQ